MKIIPLFGVTLVSIASTFANASEQIAQNQESQQRTIADNQTSNDDRRADEDDNWFSTGNPNIRIALIGDIDNTTQTSTQSYASWGGEVAWINRQSNFRPEVGGRITTSISGVKINNDEVSKVTNTYGFVGVGTTALGLVLGVRALIGYEWININDNISQQNQFALGGAGRVGYEWKRGVSIFANYGLTEHLQMIGVDVGISI